MNPKAAALRSQLEVALAGRHTNPFAFRSSQAFETIEFGSSRLDQLTGGMARGSLTEIFGPPGSGRSSLLNSTLACRTAAWEVCALSDVGNSFDPRLAAAAGVRLERLLWVRCQNADQALRAADLLIQGGGFGLIVLDFSELPPKVVRSVPLSVWFRFCRSVEDTPTVLLLVGQESNAKSCASLVLKIERQQTVWLETARESTRNRQPHPPGLLLEGWKSSAAMVRSRSKSLSVASLPHSNTVSLPSSEDQVDFAVEACWKHFPPLSVQIPSGAFRKKG